MARWGMKYGFFFTRRFGFDKRSLRNRKPCLSYFFRTFLKQLSRGIVIFPRDIEDDKMIGLILTALAWQTNNYQAVVELFLPNGQPGKNIEVQLHFMDPYHEKAIGKTRSATTNDLGVASFPLDEKPKPGRAIFFVEHNGLVGSDTISLAGDATIHLTQAVDVPGKLIDSEGKPIAGASIVPLSGSSIDPATKRSLSITIPTEVQQRWSVKTAEDGTFKLRGLPFAERLYFRVEMDKDKIDFVAPKLEKLDITIPKRGTVKVLIEGIDPAKARGFQIGLVGASDLYGNELNAITAIDRTSDQLKGEATQTLKNILPGRYFLYFQNTTQANLRRTDLKDAKPFEVRPGETTTVTINLTQAALAKGRLVDVRGKGIEGAQLVGYRRIDVNTGQSLSLGYSKTKKDGTFQFSGEPGWFSYQVQELPEGYALPKEYGDYDLKIEPVQATVEKAGSFPNLVVAEGLTFTAKVLTSDGKPASGAEVILPNTRAHFERSFTLPEDGILTVKDLHPTESICPYIRLGEAVHDRKVYKMSQHHDPVTITLDKKLSSVIRGQVTQFNGEPIRGAKVYLYHSVAGFDLENRGGMSYPLENMRTDKDGRFEFRGLWPNHQYNVIIRANQYANHSSNYFRVESGQTFEVPNVQLARTSLSIQGQVVDVAGKPLERVTLSTVDGPKLSKTNSSSQGKFTLSGFYETAGFLIAEKEGFRPQAILVDPRKDEQVRVVLQHDDGTPRSIDVPKGHQQALDELTRYLLRRMFETHDKFQAGGRAIERMAAVDPELARQWVEEAKTKFDDKTNWLGYYNRGLGDDRLTQLAVEDIDAALVEVRKLSAWSALRLAEKLHPNYPDEAIQIVEEAVLLARKVSIPNRVYTLADVGEAAIQTGNKTGGLRLISEAYTLAEKLPAEGQTRDTLAIGMTAATLAPHDWTKAKTLLDRLADPGEFNRFLAAALPRIAKDDPDKAIEMLELFKPSNTFYPDDSRVILAAEIIEKDFNRAVKLVDDAQHPRTRLRGYLYLANIVAKDQTKAFLLLEKAIELLFNNDIPGWRASYAMEHAPMVLVTAKKLDYPNLSSLVTRIISARAPGEEYYDGADQRTESIVNLAAGIALVDPEMGRQLLSTIAPMDKFVELALTKDRDWLFALALCDPTRAKSLVDRLLARAEKNPGQRGGLSDTGLSELSSLLTAKDRYQDLAMWANLPHPIDKE